jgi:DNA-binding IclR family transcriptional regulator
MSASTPATISSVGALAAELERVDGNGLAVADGEYRLNTARVAFAGIPRTEPMTA